jgi:hypothetical protein
VKSNCLEVLLRLKPELCRKFRHSDITIARIARKSADNRRRLSAALRRPQVVVEIGDTCILSALSAVLHTPRGALYATQNCQLPAPSAPRPIHQPALRRGDKKENLHGLRANANYRRCH